MRQLFVLATLVALYAFAPIPGGAQDSDEKPADSPAAMVDGQSISRASLEAKAQNRLAQIRAQEYEVKRQVLDEAVDQVLLEEEAG